MAQVGGGVLFCQYHCDCACIQMGAGTRDSLDVDKVLSTDGAWREDTP